MPTASAPLVLDGRLRPMPDHPGWLSALLPSPAVQNHAANLMPLGDGALGCAWFGGTQEGMADISIHFSRLNPGAEAWSQTVRLIDDPGRSEQNPILFPAPDGCLWLLYTSQKGGNQDTAVVRFRTSRDSGQTWSAPATLIGDAGTFVRQPLHVTADGSWLLPTFACATRPGKKWTGGFDTSAVCISGDQGRTWTRHAVPSKSEVGIRRFGEQRGVGAVHMNILDAGAVGLVALFRSRWADHIYRSTSRDGGKSWSEPAPTPLPNNNSSIQATVLQDGRIALAYNASSRLDATGRRAGLYDDLEDEPQPEIDAAAVMPVQAVERTAFWGAPRAPLCVALSGDAGSTWGQPITIDSSDGYCLTNNSRDKLNRELSYPSIRQTQDGRLHIAYTYFRQAIKYVSLPLPAR